MTTTALAVPVAELARLEFSQEQRGLIKRMYAAGASDAEFSALMEVAAIRRLNPFLRQIYFRKDLKSNTWICMVGIDGFRSIAEDSGTYDGQDEPEFTYAQDGKQIVCCKLRVHRKGISRPFIGIAHYDEYVQRTKEGQITVFWKKPHVMLAKCAEALAMRKAFPQRLSGLYAPEEIGHTVETTGTERKTKPKTDEDGYAEELFQRIAGTNAAFELENLLAEILATKGTGKLTKKEVTELLEGIDARSADLKKNPAPVNDEENRRREQAAHSDDDRAREEREERELMGHDDGPPDSTPGAS